MHPLNVAVVYPSFHDYKDNVIFRKNELSLQNGDIVKAVMHNFIIVADSASYTGELPRREYEEQAGSQSSWLSSLSSWFSSDKTTREQKPEEMRAPADKYKASPTSSESRESAERYRYMTTAFKTKLYFILRD
jgi:hypothetical protein